MASASRLYQQAEKTDNHTDLLTLAARQIRLVEASNK